MEVVRLINTAEGGSTSPAAEGKVSSCVVGWWWEMRQAEGGLFAGGW